MESVHFMALDVHCQFCHFVWSSPCGKKVHDQGRVATTVPALLEAIKGVPRPRVLVMEEGPMAGWLTLNLRAVADGVRVADPWRNRLIAKDGDKDDPIDAAKLLALARGGFIREVHQAQTQEMLLLKQHVGFYHRQVGERVEQANRIIWHLRRWGVMVKEAELADPKSRAEALGRLPRDPTLKQDMEYMLACYDLVAGQIQELREGLERLARGVPVIGRFVEVPGVKWVRASTFYAYVGTPWRFATKQALWKYLGIGLERRHSGEGPERLGVPWRCNFVLKDMILGAAQSAADAQDNNPFADAYRRYIKSCSPRIARRSVARMLAAVLWGMWKNNGDYRPDWVGVPAKELDSKP